MPALVNGLGLGIHREAVPGFLERAQRSAKTVESYIAAKSQRKSEYDQYERWRVRSNPNKKGNPFSQELCLFYKGGFLRRKCFVPADDASNHQIVYRREILSGKQYPPADSELMEQVKWGRAHVPLIVMGEGKSAIQSRLRCGIVLDTRSVFARKYGYNVLVLLQNIGPRTIDQEFCLTWYGSPEFRLSRDMDDSFARVSSQTLGAAATNWRVDVMRKILDSPDLKGTAPEGSPFRAKLLKRGQAVVKFRFERCDYIYAWFKVEELAQEKVLEAEFSAFGVLQGFREWRARSGTLRLHRQKAGFEKRERCNKRK
ncbi:MAG: hypothetical protein IH899_15570 [Planctomycetes bacterium]|nr:hypothetical protein [Planctomycetota bacterium]